MQIDMYFLPKEDLNSCPVAGRLANNVQLMRQVDLPLKPLEREYFVKFGNNLILNKIDWMTGKISSRKFDHNGLVQEIKGGKLSKRRDFGISPVPEVAILFDSLPIIGTHYALKGLKKVKFSFYTIPGIIPGKIKMKDVIVDVGCRFHSRHVCFSSNYVALIVNNGHSDAPRSWTSGLNSQNEMRNESRFQKLMILLKVERENDNLYNFIEISRHNLESIQGIFKVEMIYNKTEDTILFTARTFFKKDLMLLIYNVKSKSIEQSIEAMVDPVFSQIFFVDHVDYEGGVIVTVCWYKNHEVRLFSKIGKKGYSLVKCFSMDLTSLLDYDSYCCSNRHSQILFFLVKQWEVIIYDLFDTSDFAVLPYGEDEGPPQFYFNESGEEIYVYHRQRMSVYIYKSMLKSLLLQSALITAKFYTKAQLRDMNLPRQLYKYLNTLAFFSSEVNAIQ